MFIISFVFDSTIDEKDGMFKLGVVLLEKFSFLQLAIFDSTSCIQKLLIFRSPS